MKHSQLKQLIKEEISKVLELRTIDYKPKDDLVHLYLMTYSDKVGEPYFERKYKKFRNDVESLLQSFGAAVENDHGISDKNLKILVNRKDKIKVKNILTKLSNRYGFESELEIDTLEEIHSAINENKLGTPEELKSFLYSKQSKIVKDIKDYIKLKKVDIATYKTFTEEDIKQWIRDDAGTYTPGEFRITVDDILRRGIDKYMFHPVYDEFVETTYNQYFKGVEF